MTIQIAELMETSGVKFGTSGARGLADAITDFVAYAYTRAFLQQQKMRHDTPIAAAIVGGDLRPSTPRIMAAVGAACADAGLEVINGGFLPTPAVALAGISHGIPAIMVTGSHIPDDRNGIKFHRFDGEIDKTDEAQIKALAIDIDQTAFDTRGNFVQPAVLPAASGEATHEYRRRFLERLPADALAGLKIGIYQHSTVGRDVLLDVIAALGAEAVALGRADHFIPVDTEALRAEDVQLARNWAGEQGFDAIVSADGDCDRPLVADEQGRWLRGDVLGVITARFLGAAAIALPVSCNSVAERCGFFDRVLRTRIGSPYVIEAMHELAAAGASGIVGFEANGGFLQQTPLTFGNGILTALPTRDAMLPVLSALLAARAHGGPLSALVDGLPRRFTASDRVVEFPTELAQARIAALAGTRSGAMPALEPIATAMPWVGAAAVAVDATDGLRITFNNDEIVHLRPSGNAPELRCYTEAASEARANALLQAGMAMLESWR
ncbi:MAG: phosphomannomutase [Gammaproteobacteria bacterium]